MIGARVTTMSRIIPLLAVIISLAAVSGCQSRPQEPAEALPSAQSLAVEAERRGDWATAANHWTIALSAEPINSSYKLSLVRSLRLSNSCGRAATTLAQLQTEKPVDIAVMLEVGKCHLVSGRLDAAVAALEAAITADPNSWEAETVLATTHDYRERHKDALPHHDRAITLAPNRPIPLSNKAISLALSGNLTNGLKIMRQAAALPDATSRVRLNLAFLEAIAGNGDLAVMMTRNEVETDDTESTRLLQRIATAAQKAKNKKK